MPLSMSCETIKLHFCLCKGASTQLVACGGISAGSTPGHHGQQPGESQNEAYRMS